MLTGSGASVVTEQELGEWLSSLYGQNEREEEGVLSLSCLMHKNVFRHDIRLENVDEKLVLS